MPSEGFGVGMMTIACSAGYGDGGLGRHLAEFVEHYRCDGTLSRYYCSKIRPGDEDLGVEIRPWTGSFTKRWNPISWHRGLSQYFGFEAFDHAVANQYLNVAATHVGFSGQSLKTFRRARQVGVKSLELVSPTAHVNKVNLLHSQASRLYPIESHWLSRPLISKCLKEYDIADRIIVNSEYVKNSFIDQGFAVERLLQIPISSASRFRRRLSIKPHEVFEILYTGSLTVSKGVPLLIEAFSRANLGLARLTLIGHSGSRGMRKFLEKKIADDPRIQIRPGDPLPLLQVADLYVHPSFQDGFSYAVAEAIAVGVPVIVTQDTGAKEMIQSPVDGWIIPTGNVDALTTAMELARNNCENIPNTL